MSAVRMGVVAAVESEAERVTDGVRPHTAEALLGLIGPRARAPRSSERVDWDWLIERAQAHKVAALVAAGLERADAWKDLGAAHRALLNDARPRATQIAATAERTLQAVGARFAAEAIPYFVVKGGVLAATVYARTDVRAFSDVDVVVRPEHVGPAVEALHALGYRLGQVRQTLGAWPEDDAEVAAARRVTRRFYERFDHELPFITPARTGFLAVDLHWRLASRRRLPVESADLWRETRTVPIGALDVPTLSPEATLLHLAIHATGCTLAGFRLLHLCDVAWALERAAHSPARLRMLAQQWGVSHRLGVVFALTRQVFGIPAIGEPASAVDAAAVARIARADFLVGTSDPSARTRWWKEARWGLTMGCLTDNVKRSMAVRWTRAAWQLHLAWPRRRAGGSA